MLGEILRMKNKSFHVIIKNLNVGLNFDRKRMGRELFYGSYMVP